MQKLIIYIILLCFLQIPAFAQTPYLDSLKEELSRMNDSREKADLCNKLSYEDNRVAEGLAYAKKAFSLSEKIDYDNGKADALKNIALNNKRQGNFEVAFNNYFKAAELYEHLGKDKELSIVYNYLAELHYLKGDYDKTIRYLLKAITIAEKGGDEKGVAGAKNNIGNVYFDQENYAKALTYYFESYQTSEKYNDQIRIANTSDNIGNCYHQLKQFEEALDYFNKALLIRKEHKLLNKIGISYINIGSCYYTMGDAPTALKYQKEALRIEELQGNKPAIINALLKIGEIYNDQNKLKLAEKYLERSAIMSNELGMNKELSRSYKLLSENYYKQNIYKKAYDYYKFHTDVKDSLFSEEKSEQIMRIEAVFQNERKEKEIELLSKENELRTVEIEKQRTRNIAVTVSLALTIILVGMVLVGLVQKQKANKLLEEQKRLIEKKNKDITSSISYASQIQKAILPNRKKLTGLLPESFILFKPKDLVSGDFYWFRQVKHKIILAVVDCTGHGVPGAFMSLISNELLRDIIVSRKITTPKEILRELHHGIVQNLKKEEHDSFNVDGMNIALCTLDMEQYVLDFASSGRPLVHLSEDQVNVISGGRFPLGLITKKERVFEQKTIHLRPGDQFYIFTDGFSDQFGGPNNEKLTRKGLIEQIYRNRKRPLNRQEEALISYFNEWKGNNPQLDDVCMIGARI